MKLRGVNKRFGVIDIGSLKVKVLIAEQTSANGFSPIFQSNKMTRLGSRLDQKNAWPQTENFESTIEELQRIKQVFKEYGVEKVRVVSTHVLREMERGQEVAEEISQRTGFKVEIISQQDEAELFFKAVMRDFQVGDEFAMIDVGSGSVQLLIGSKDSLERTFLFKTGSSYLYEHYTARRDENGNPSQEEVERMRQYILEQLVPVPRDLKTPLIYGSSNIIDVFKVLNLPLEQFPYSASHPYQTSLDHVERFFEKVVFVPYKRRIEEYYFKDQPYYMWGIDTALLNVLTIAKHLGSEYVVPSNANISQGLLLSLM